MKYWGYFAGFACFSECFLSIRDVFFDYLCSLFFTSF